MADPDNQGQFGNRDDTEEQARKGGENSDGQFGAANGLDPQQEGAKGGSVQSDDGDDEEEE